MKEQIIKILKAHSEHMVANNCVYEEDYQEVADSIAVAIERMIRNTGETLTYSREIIPVGEREGIEGGQPSDEDIKEMKRLWRESGVIIYESPLNKEQLVKFHKWFNKEYALRELDSDTVVEDYLENGVRL